MSDGGQGGAKDGTLRALRARNAWRRLASGLPPSGEIVSPEVPNDLYQAHLSLYVFAGDLARGKSVLDVACGTGYGCARLLASGAARVVGVERDPWSLRYARRKLGRPGLSFGTGGPSELSDDLGSFDLVVAMGALPRVDDPDRALAGIARHLAPGGSLLASLPPILDGQTLALHQARPRERSSRYLWDWEEALRERFPSLRLFRHLPPPGGLPDFADPRPSTLRAEDFRFEELPLSEIYDVGSLGAVFVAGA
ncbi:MAG TPA: class I SAM-dependent methyltransferase [Thermoanaerobaculia bacterium]